MTVSPALVSRAVEVAERLAREATELIAATTGRGASPSSKGTPFDWVTETDHEVERRTRQVLAEEFPDVPVLGEEFGADAGADPDADRAALRWVVDPVDGTANYVAGLPWCAYSLALVDADGPVVGVVAEPDRGRVYLAARGRGAHADGQPLRLRPVPALGGTLVCTEYWPGLGPFAERAVAAHAGVRVLGSAALALVQVALGRASAAVLNRYSEWDVAGALALVTEAGAVVLGRDGRPDPLPTDGVLVAAPEVADEVLDWWRSARLAATAARGSAGSAR